MNFLPRILLDHIGNQSGVEGGYAEVFCENLYTL